MQLPTYDSPEGSIDQRFCVFAKLLRSLVPYSTQFSPPIHEPNPIKHSDLAQFIIINKLLGPVLYPWWHSVRKAARTDCMEDRQTKYGDFPLRLGRRCWVLEERRLKTNYSCDYFPSNSTIWPRYANVTDGRTDQRTDGQLTVAIGRFALRASRGKSILVVCRLEIDSRIAYSSSRVFIPQNQLTQL